MPISIKLTNRVMRTTEIIIKGSGEFVLGLVDREGRILMTKRLIASGSADVEVRTRVPETLNTLNGEASVVPVLVKSSSKQVATFGGKSPAAFTSQRCRALNFSSAVMKKAASSAAKRAKEPHMRLSAAGTRVGLSL